MYKKVPLKTNSLKQYKVFINLLTINLAWEVIMLDTLLMSSKAREDYKREWSVYKNFKKRSSTYLMTNPDTKSHLRQSLPRQWPTASSRLPLP